MADTKYYIYLAAYKATEWASGQAFESIAKELYPSFNIVRLFAGADFEKIYMCLEITEEDFLLITLKNKTPNLMHEIINGHNILWFRTDDSLRHNHIVKLLK